MRTFAQGVRACVGHVVHRRERSANVHDDERASEAHEDSINPSQYENQNTNPYQTYWGGTSGSPTFHAVGTNEQPEIGNNRGVRNETETDGLYRLALIIY